MMKIVIQVSPEVAQALHQTEELLKIAGTFCITLEPMHRDTDDPALKSYFTADVQDDGIAQRVINRLQQAGGVTAAYVTPSYGLP